MLRQPAVGGAYDLVSMDIPVDELRAMPERISAWFSLFDNGILVGQPNGVL